MSPTRRPIEERFWDFVPTRTLGACWEWTGRVNRDGYGLLSTSRPHRVGRLAHRVAYEIMVGPIPEGLNVLHHCDNPPCVNAYECLFLGTQADNVADMVAKGRENHASVNVGAAHGRAKLTDDAVREIRRRSAEGQTRRDVADAFRISRANVSLIVNGKAWSHVR